MPNQKNADFYWIYRCQTQNPTYIHEIAKTDHLQSPVKFEPFNILTSGFLRCVLLSLKISENLNVMLFKKCQTIINSHSGHIVHCTAHMNC